MKPLKSNIRKHSAKMVETMVENISNYLHFEYATTSGDISPMQQFALNDTKEILSNLIAEQIFQNLDFTKKEKKIDQEFTLVHQNSFSDK